MKINKKYYLFLIVYAAFCLYKIRVGMYHDEPIHVDYSKLFLSGQYGLTQVWDFLQMPGYLAAPFTYLFYRFTGSFDGIILFQRQIFLVIHFLCAIFVYRTLKTKMSLLQAQLVSVFSVIYVWHFYTICYKSVLYWGITLSFLCLIRYADDGKKKDLALTVLFFCAAVLAFPTAVLMAVPYTVYLRRHAVHGKEGLAGFWGGCLIIAGMVLAYVFFTLPGGSFATLWSAYVKAAEKSDHGTIFKMLRRFAEVGGIWIAANVAAVVYRKIPLLRKKTGDVYGFLLLAFWGLIIGAVVLRYHKISTSLVWCAFCAFFFIAEALVRRGYLERNGAGEVAAFLMQLSVWMLLVITLATNTGIAVISFGAVYGMMGILILAANHTGGGISRYSIALVSCILAVHLLSSSLLVLEYDLNKSDADNRTYHVFQQRTPVTDGPGKGLLFNEDTLGEYHNALRVVKAHVRDDDRMMIMSEHFRRYVGMLSCAATEVVHSELEYETDTALPLLWCDAFPELMPTVVLVDADFVGDVETWLRETPTGVYLTEHFDLSRAVRDGNWLILRL